VNADVIFTGHSHVPYIKRCGGKIVVNPGSVGEPRDGDPRASCALFDTVTGQIALIRVEYDAADTRARLKETGFPNFALFCLRTGFLPDDPNEE
jgi:predicted phosphodiesterase